MHKNILVRCEKKICYLHFSNAVIWVWNHISHLCSASVHTFVSLRAVYKRHQMPNYQQIPAKCWEMAKRQWQNLCFNRRRNQLVCSQYTSNMSNRFCQNWRGWLRHYTISRSSWIRFLMEYIECLIDLILPVSNRNENQEYLPFGGGL